ncbi:phosphorothioated DNA-binding restriction endonuclease [Streptomyces sp. NPDC048057]|uniref:phosphorothioated DNA-binding restriction endonuclease n=1 Tax=Streptomyces sp. NPDC048057 TaxID=3155628 RepID=UPI0033EAD36C
MDWVEQAGKLRQWAQNGMRAPHKPLLFLYALGRFQEDPDGALAYSAVEDDLKRLLGEYAPRNRKSPNYPFHHLASDGVWEVHTSRGPGSPGNGVTQLREANAVGRLAPDLRRALRQDSALLGRIARVLLDRHFPPSLHGELCDAVGLELELAETATVSARRRSRDRQLRDLVLTAYEYQCAFCGYDGHIGTTPVGLEAAHVRWWALDGPDTVDNALCLCSLHHKLFDKGVLGVTPTHHVMVSQSFVGRSESARTHVLALSARPLLGPQPGNPRIAAEHREWHEAQVFHGKPREPAAGVRVPASGE